MTLSRKIFKFSFDERINKKERLKTILWVDHEIENCSIKSLDTFAQIGLISSKQECSPRLFLTS